MKNYFYPKSTYTAVVAFADLFNDMTVRVYDPKGKIVGVKPVPCSLTPREKIVSILKASDVNDVDPQFDNYLPRISINMSGLNWDSNRQRGKYEKRILNIEYDDNGKRNIQTDIQAVPYKLSFTVDIWAKYMTDGIQLIENIAPFFNPEVHVSYKERNFGLEHKGKVILDGISYNPVYEYGENERRILQWSLSFTMDTTYWKPMELKPEILKSIISINNVPCKKIPFQGDKITVYEPDVLVDAENQFDAFTKLSIFNLDLGESYDLMTNYWKDANRTMNAPDNISCVDDNCATDPGPRPTWDTSLTINELNPPPGKPCIDVDPITKEITNYWQEIVVENNVMKLKSYFRVYDKEGNTITDQTLIPNSEFPNCFPDNFTIPPSSTPISSMPPSSLPPSGTQAPSAEPCVTDYQTNGDE